MELISGRLKVRAELADDRYTFAVFAKCGGSWSRILVSEDGDPCRDYPLSPPIQQAVVEEFADQLAAMLGVGMSGDGYWSLSIVAIERDGLDFDIACRWTSRIPWLGSTWRIEQPWRIASHHEASPTPSWIDLVSGGTDRFRFRAAPDVIIALEDGLLTLSAENPAIDPAPTVRWKFSLHSV